MGVRGFELVKKFSISAGVAGIRSALDAVVVR